MASLPPEVNFAQRLAGNTKKIRDRALKKLRKYMKSKSASKKGGFTKEDILKLWKGLHYCLWMQDKAVIQEELSLTLSQLVHELSTVDSQLLFVQVFFITEAREWNSIDVWRLDKFMSLVRNMLNESLILMKKQNWRGDYLQRLVTIFGDEVMSPISDTIPDGLKIHFADIYLDEVEKVGSNQLNGDQLVKLLEPFINYIRTAKNTVVVRRIVSTVFDPVITRAVALLKKSTSETGEETEEEEIPYKSLKFDNSRLAEHLFEVSKQPTMLSRNRPIIYKLVQRLQDVDKGVVPRKKEVVIGPGVTDKDINEAIRQLANFERQKNKKRKKKKKSTDNPDSETESDTEGKENDMSDQNNNNDSPAVFNAPEVDVSPGGKVGGKGKRKLSAGLELSQSDEPMRKVTRKSLDEATEKKPFKKLKEKLLKSRKDSPRKVADIMLTPNSHKSKKEKTPVKAKKTDSGWSVTTTETQTVKSTKKIYSDKDGVSVINVCKTAMKTPPNIVVNKASGESAKVSGQKRTYTETSVTSKEAVTTSALKEDGASVSSPVWTNEVQDGEVEIYVPNKKFKGKQTRMHTPEFATFDLSKPPMAYVKKPGRKSLTELSSSKKLKGRQSVGGSAKRVSFDMKKNKSQAFKDSLKSPMTPYNPSKKPDQSILKTPDPNTPLTAPVMALSTDPGPSLRKLSARLQHSTPIAPVQLISSKPLKKATPMKRSKAKDFFYL